MTGWFVTLLSIVSFLLALFLGIFIAWFAIEFIKKLRFEKVKKELSGKHRYHCYYFSEKDLKNDSKAKDLASISYHGYTDTTYEVFYKKLTTDRIPINVLVNWTRTIVEDLTNSVSPINHVLNWSNYFNSAEYKDYAVASVHPDFVVFEDYELAYIWGAVYYWLKTFVDGFDNDALLDYIEKIACKKQFLRPYFYHYKNLSEGNDDTIEVYGTPNLTPQKRYLTAEQTALLWLAIATITEGEVAKKNLAPTISKISGVGISSIKNKIVGSFKEDDKKAVASIFEKSMPNLAAKIMKM